MPDGPQLSVADLERDGFGDDPVYKCAIVEDVKNKKLVGFVIYYWIYSTWQGRSVFMEDLYVKKEFRGRGLGKGLWKVVVEDALSYDCPRCRFNVLNWNNSAIAFYKANGATNLTETEGWLVFQLKKRRNEIFGQ